MSTQTRAPLQLANLPSIKIALYSQRANYISLMKYASILPSLLALLEQHALSVRRYLFTSNFAHLCLRCEAMDGKVKAKAMAAFVVRNVSPSSGFL